MPETKNDYESTAQNTVTDGAIGFLTLSPPITRSLDYVGRYPYWIPLSQLPDVAGSESLDAPFVGKGLGTGVGGRLCKSGDCPSSIFHFQDEFCNSGIDLANRCSCPRMPWCTGEWAAAKRKE